MRFELLDYHVDKEAYLNAVMCDLDQMKQQEVPIMMKQNKIPTNCEVEQLIFLFAKKCSGKRKIRLVFNRRKQIFTFQLLLLHLAA